MLQRKENLNDIINIDDDIASLYYNIILNILNIILYFLFLIYKYI